MQAELLIYIALGGAAGAVARYTVSYWVSQQAGGAFPLGTWIINLLGCFLLGLLSGLAGERLALSPAIRAAVAVGFIGAFTTFSTFSFETLRLLEDGSWSLAALYAGSSLFLGVAAAWGGQAVARYLTGGWA